MDFRDEVRVGAHTYGVSAIREPATDDERGSTDQPAGADGQTGADGQRRVTVEFTGARLDDGRVIAEGNLLVAEDALVDSTLFLTRTLDGIAALHGRTGPGRRSGAAQRPANAGQPWTSELDEVVRTRWMSGTDTTAGALVGEIARELGRSRSSVRARLARVGCDPDVPGRLLNGAANP